MKAAAQIPMKRELKDPVPCGGNVWLACCSPNPYEEGTERPTVSLLALLRNHGCSPNPYEEGTESCQRRSASGFHAIAAAQIPMKRELKDFTMWRRQSNSLCCSPNPYEEGTERKAISGWTVRPA